MEQNDKKCVVISAEERSRLEEEWCECIVREFRKEMVEYGIG